MIQKFTKIFYTILSVFVAVCCAGVLTMTAAAFSLEGEGNRTDFTVNALTVNAVSSDDSFFREGENAAEWCCVLVDATANTWNLSPYTYTVESFSVKTLGMFRNEENVFVVLEDPIAYARANPQDFVLRVYLHVPPDKAAAEVVSKLTFTADASTKSLGAIEEEMKMYLPKLDMAQQEAYTIQDNTKPAMEQSAAGSFFYYFSQTEIL